MRLLLFCYFGLMCHTMSSQPMKDVWLMGYAEYDVPWYGHARIDWEGNKRTLTKPDLPLQFDQTMATWVDQDGKLLLFSNGCAVVHAEAGLISDDLNPGDERDVFCPDYGYPLEGGALFIDDPADSNGVLLLHQGRREHNVAVHVRDKLYLSRFLVDKQGAEALSTNEVLIDAEIERFVAVRHGNGRDWWVLCPAILSDQWYVIHIHPEGYSVELINTFEGKFNTQHCARGMPSLAISPRGDLISRWNGNCGLRVYSWDRCGGQLEYLNSWTVDRIAWKRWGVGSTIFSPSGRYIYTNDHLAVYRLDTEASSPTLDTMFMASRIWGTPLNQMGLGADGRIYISQPGSDSVMAVIHAPDLWGNLPYIVPRGYSIGRLYRGTMPVYVNRQAGALSDSPCDSLVVSVDNPAITGTPAQPDIYVYPNPASHEFIVEAPPTYDLRNYILFNTLGEEVSSGSLMQDRRIRVAGLPAGWYLLFLNPEADDMAILKVIISH
jgi:hypothetical protein